MPDRTRKPDQSRSQDPDPPRKPNKSKSDWPDVAKFTLLKLIDNGLGALLLLAVLLCVLAWVLTNGMSSADRKDLILQTMRMPYLAPFGWALALLELFAFRYIYQERDRTHEREMQRCADEKNKAVQAQFPFQLQSSEPPTTKPPSKGSTP